MASIKSLPFFIFSLVLVHTLASPLLQNTFTNLSLRIHSWNQQAPRTITESTHQSSTTETFPVCDFDFALDALQLWGDCSDCAEAVEWYDLFGELHPSARCSPECCADTFLITTGHFLRCKNGCCYRVVSLQLSPGLTDEQAVLVIQSQGFAVNGVKFVGKSSIGRCEVEAGPSDDSRCGPRCATQIQDRTACAGRNTAEIPKWGEPMQFPPCSPGFADGPPQNGGTQPPTSTGETTETDSSSGDTSSDDTPSSDGSQSSPPDGEGGNSDSESAGTPSNEGGQAGSSSEDGTSSNDEQEDSQPDQGQGGTDQGESASTDADSTGQGEQGNPGRECFPGDGTVSLSNGELVQMINLRAGQKVYVGNSQYSEVIGFTHDDAHVVREHLHLSLDSGNHLTITKGHYIYANDKLIPARNVIVGDVVRLGDGRSAVVVRVAPIFARGLFSPQTAHGDIVVNGVVVSTYTEAVDPMMAHAFLVPFRVLAPIPVARNMLSRVAGIFRQLLSSVSVIQEDSVLLGMILPIFKVL